MTNSTFPKLHKAALLLGTNLGDREEILTSAREKIETQAGKIIKTSAIYSTAPWGIEDQPDFLNQTLLIETSFNPLQLLETLQPFEHEAGRIRKEKWGPRLLDIDILYYDNEIIDLPSLKIPHLFMAQRRFTLVPLADISPDWVHPVLKKNVVQLLEECPDKGEVKLFEK